MLFNDAVKDFRNTIDADIASNPFAEIRKAAMRFDYREYGFFINKASDFLEMNKVDSTSVPSWYANLPLPCALYQEAFGWGAVAEWFSDDYADSDTLIVDGENCFIRRNGHEELMKQRILPAVVGVVSIFFDEDDVVLDNGVRVKVADDGFVLTKPTPSLITKQDIAITLWNRFRDSDTGFDMDMDCIDSCTMRKTNSFGITLLDGRKFKVVVKDDADEE